MKRGRVLLPLLVLLFSSIAVAQEGRPGPDPVIRSAQQALRDGRLTDAEKILTDAIHQMEQSDPDSPRLADYLKRLARVLDGLGRHDEYAALVERAYAIDRKAYGPTDLRLTNDLIQQAMAAQDAGDTGKAERLLNQALEAVRANADKTNSQPGTAMAEGVIGWAVTFYSKEHRWMEADALLPELTRMCGLIPEPYRTGYDPCGRLPEVVAEIHSAEGKTPDVQRLPYSGNLPRELESLNESAKKFSADGLYPSAEDAYQRAIVLAQKMEADPKILYDGLDVGEMILLGELYEKEGLKDRAEETYLGALQIQEKVATGEPTPSQYAALLSPQFLVALYRGEGRQTDAESLLKQVIEIQVKALGERNRAVVQNLVLLAELDEDEGKSDPAKYAKAAPLYERALAIQEANLAPNNAQLINVLAPYAEFLDKTHESAKAAEVRARIARILPAENGESQ